MPFVVISSDTNTAIKQIKQVSDNILTPSYKWFSLSQNKLDGSFHPIDTTNTYQVGWWGGSLSDANGNVTNQIITIQEQRSIHKLRVAGDSLLGEYPVDFTMKLTKNNVVIYTETVVGNTNVIWSKELDKVYDVDSITLSVTKINTPNTVVKIVDMFSPDDFKRHDTLRITAEEESGINETITLTLVEDSFIQVSILKGDQPSIVVNKKEGLITGELNSHDSWTLKDSTKQKQIINITSPRDHLKVHLNERSKIKNVHTVMDSNLRQVFGKVEITYAAPFLGDDVSIVANQIGRNTAVTGIADNTTHSEYKWASLHDNKLDGSYHPMPLSTDRKWHAGLWGTKLSDATGRFVDKPVITIVFVPRPLYYLKVAGDDMLMNYPVDFTIDVLDHNEDVIYTEEVIGNTNILWYKDLNPVLNDVTKVQLTIHRISKPYQVFKLTEFFNSIVETYYNKQIVNMHLLEELDYIESSITLGAVSSNEIDIVLDNSTGKFNLMDTSTPLHNLIKRNRKVRAWLGAEIVPDEVEWYPLGTFYTTKWDIPDRSLTASLTARDRLDVLNYSDFTYSKVYKNMTLGQLYKLILDDAGLIEGVDYEVSNTLDYLVVPYAWFPKQTHRDALQRLSACAIVQLYCDREGKIIVTDMDPTNTVYFTYKDSSNVISKDFPFVWNEITNYVEVSANIFAEGTKKAVLESREILVIPANTSMELKYDYNTLPVTTIDAPIITSDTGIILDSYTTYAWGIVMKVRNSTASNKNITSIVVNGLPLEKQTTSINVAKDDALIKENGTLKTSIGHDFIQSTVYAQSLAQNLLNGYRDARYDVKLTCRGNIGVYLKQKVNIEDSKMNTTKTYVVKRQTIDWNGALSAITECKNLS